MAHLRSFLVVSRCEFMPGGIFFLFMVSALACRNWNGLHDHTAILVCGAIVWYLSHLIGSQVNCLADYNLDRDHKPRLVLAVDDLGRQAIWGSILIESLSALLTTLVMVRLSGKWLLLPLWSLGWMVTLGYSLEPIRFKRRGFWNPFSLILVLYAFPITFGYIALCDSRDLTVVALLISIGIQMFSLILTNEVEDIPEDTAQGIRTPCVRYGLWPLALTALVLFSVGAVLTLIAFSYLIEPHGFRIVIAFFGAAGQLLVLRDLARLTCISRRTMWAKSNEVAIPPEIRHLGRRNAVHFAILGVTIALGCALSLH